MLSSEGPEKNMGEELSQFPLADRKDMVFLKSMFKEDSGSETPTLRD